MGDWEKFQRAFDRAEASGKWADDFKQALGQTLREQGAESEVATVLRSVGPASTRGLPGVTAEGVARAADAAAWMAIEEFARVIADQSADDLSRHQEP